MQRSGMRNRSAPISWLVVSAVISLFVVVPVLVVLGSVFADSGDTWSHLVETRLKDYVTNTIVLTIGVCVVATFVGVACAWLVAFYNFPGRRILSWGLLLPLAVPAYLSAYALTDLLQFSGPVQTWLRSAGVLDADSWFPSIRSLPGAMMILSFSLYPYVFFAARTAFMEQSQTLIEASRTLGHGPIGTLMRASLPLARPSIVAAMLLVMMETIADFGAVEYCAVDTFATGIYRTWLGLNSIEAAGQLSSLVVLLLFVLITAGLLNRRHARFHVGTARAVARRRTRLSGAKGLCAGLACVVPILIGFAFPTSRLLILALAEGDARASELLGRLALNTFLLAAVAAFVAVMLTICVAYAARLHRRFLGPALTEVCRAGYALPGPVIAIGVLTALTWLDHRINWAYELLAPERELPGLILSGSVIAVLVGYQTRFLAVSLALIQGSFERVHRNLDDAARTLGAGPRTVLLRIHIPAMRASIFAAALLVFVDVTKELPATLMLRPFNFDTLAVRVYQLASDERLGEASTGALAIIVVGLIPIVVINGLIELRQRSEGQRT